MTPTTDGGDAGQRGRQGGVVAEPFDVGCAEEDEQEAGHEGDPGDQERGEHAGDPRVEVAGVLVGAEERRRTARP